VEKFECRVENEAGSYAWRDSKRMEGGENVSDWTLRSVAALRSSVRLLVRLKSSSPFVAPPFVQNRKSSILFLRKIKDRNRIPKTIAIIKTYTHYPLSSYIINSGDLEKRVSKGAHSYASQRKGKKAATPGKFAKSIEDKQDTG
jgi:hypothetical protein